MNTPLAGISAALFGLGIVCLVVMLYIFRHVKRTKVVSPRTPTVAVLVFILGASSFVVSAVLILVATAS